MLALGFGPIGLVEKQIKKVELFVCFFFCLSVRQLTEKLKKKQER